MTKPYKGFISDWQKIPLAWNEPGKHLGYLIKGKAEDHPKFAGRYITTSMVFKHDEETGIVETRNSIYQLHGKERLNDG